MSLTKGADSSSISQTHTNMMYIKVDRVLEEQRCKTALQWTIWFTAAEITHGLGTTLLQSPGLGLTNAHNCLVEAICSVQWVKKILYNLHRHAHTHTRTVAWDFDTWHLIHVASDI